MRAYALFEDIIAARHIAAKLAALGIAVLRSASAYENPCRFCVRTISYCFVCALAHGPRRASTLDGRPGILAQLTGAAKQLSRTNMSPQV